MSSEADSARPNPPEVVMTPYSPQDLIDKLGYTKHGVSALWTTIAQLCWRGELALSVWPDIDSGGPDAWIHPMKPHLQILLARFGWMQDISADASTMMTQTEFRWVSGGFSVGVGVKPSEKNDAIMTHLCANHRFGSSQTLVLRCAPSHLAVCPGCVAAWRQQRFDTELLPCQQDSLDEFHSRMPDNSCLSFEIGAFTRLSRLDELADRPMAVWDFEDD